MLKGEIGVANFLSNIPVNVLCLVLMASYMEKKPLPCGTLWILPLKKQDGVLICGLWLIIISNIISSCIAESENYEKQSSAKHHRTQAGF